jgi:hypothetical protein
MVLYSTERLSTYGGQIKSLKINFRTPEIQKKGLYLLLMQLFSKHWFGRGKQVSFKSYYFIWVIPL